MQLKEHELIKFNVLGSGFWIGPSTMPAVTVYIFCKQLLIIVILQNCDAVNELAESNK